MGDLLLNYYLWLRCAKQAESRPFKAPSAENSAGQRRNLIGNPLAQSCPQLTYPFINQSLGLKSPEFRFICLVPLCIVGDICIWDIWPGLTGPPVGLAELDQYSEKQRKKPCGRRQKSNKGRKSDLRKKHHVGRNLLDFRIGHLRCALGRRRLVLFDPDG